MELSNVEVRFLGRKLDDDFGRLHSFGGGPQIKLVNDLVESLAMMATAFESKFLPSNMRFNGMADLYM